MKKKDVIGIDVSKLTIDAYVKIAQVHAEFSNDNKGFRCMSSNKSELFGLKIKRVFSQI